MENPKTRTILVVEDELNIRQALVDNLTNEGLNILEAADGEIGLQLAQQEHPDLILLDILLPKMDGLALLKQLRESDWGRAVPVILLTNLSDSRKIAEALEGDVCDYLVKTDWKMDDVIKKIKERLSQI